MATVPPPHRTHGVQPVSPAQALTLLSRFLSAAETQPWLHPDALLSERGPQFSGAASGGLIMHNLRRVEAGLRGERMGADISFEEEDGLNGEEETRAGDAGQVMEGVVLGGEERGVGGSRPREMSAGEAAEGEEGAEQQEEERGNWVDMGTYQRHQDFTEGDLGKTDNVVDDGGRVPQLEEGRRIDREARKRAKAERRKEEKRKRAEARLGEKDAG